MHIYIKHIIFPALYAYIYMCVYAYIRTGPYKVSAPCPANSGQPSGSLQGALVATESKVSSLKFLVRMSIPPKKGACVYMPQRARGSPSKELWIYLLGNHGPSARADGWLDACLRYLAYLAMSPFLCGPWLHLCSSLRVLHVQTWIGSRLPVRSGHQRRLRHNDQQSIEKREI